jgi:hypothetical protein
MSVQNPSAVTQADMLAVCKAHGVENVAIMPGLFRPKQTPRMVAYELNSQAGSRAARVCGQLPPER